MSYIVNYYGENFTNGSVNVAVTRAAIDLPAVDSDVNVFVIAMNVFGSGPSSNISLADIGKLCKNIDPVCASTLKL